MKEIFQKLFKNKKAVVETQGNHLQILIINDDTQELTIALGITEERKQVLIKLAALKDGENNAISNFLAFSKEAKHVNELAFLTYLYGCHVGGSVAQAHTPFSMLMGLLGGNK